MSLFKGSNYAGQMTPKTGGFYGDYSQGPMGHKWKGEGKSHSPKMSESKGLPKFKSTCKGCGGKL